MVKKKYCRGCVYRGNQHEKGYECNYCFLTGRSRLARTTPEQKEAGECPVREVGARHRGVPEKGLARPPRITRDRLRALYDRGLNDHEIASEAGCSESLVFRWRHDEERLPANYGPGGKQIPLSALRATSPQGEAGQRGHQEKGCL